jgi:hypothetical protein
MDGKEGGRKGKRKTRESESEEKRKKEEEKLIRKKMIGERKGCNGFGIVRILQLSENFVEFPRVVEKMLAKSCYIALLLLAISSLSSGC